MLEGLTKEQMEQFDPERSYIEQSAEVAGVDKDGVFRATKDTVMSFWTVQKYITQAIDGIESGDLPASELAQTQLTPEDFESTRRVLDTLAEEFKTDLFKMMRGNPEYLLEMVGSMVGADLSSEQENEQAESYEPQAGYL